MPPSHLPWESVADRLATWGESYGRTPAWRGRSDAYSLAVAEVLLQKTRAGDAEPVWLSILASFPVPGDLARADPERVQAMVGGLGLGRQRAQRLRTMARALDAHDMLLPGIGPYGSAVIALATGAVPSHAPVDGNVARVISRLLGLTWARGEPRKKAEIREAAAALIDSGNPLATLYALVDLGSSVCTPTKPSCPDCPLVGWCATARASGADRSPSVD